MLARLRSNPVESLGLAALGAIFFVLCWTRLIGLNQSLWNDEVAAVRSFIVHGPVEIVTNYAAGNHVLFDLLAWGTTYLLGDSESLYRAWSVLPAIAAVVILTWWCWRVLARPGAAVLFAFLVTASPFHLELMKQARGYGLATLATALMLISAHWATRRGGNRAFSAFGASAVIGTATFPPFLLSAYSVGLAMLADPGVRRRIPRRVAIAIGALSAIGGALAVYILVRGDVPSTGDPLPLHAFAVDSIRNLFSPTFNLLFSNRDPDLIVPLALGLVALAMVELWWRGERTVALALALPIATTYTVYALFELAAAERFFSYLQPYLMLGIAIGAAQLGAWALAGLRTAPAPLNDALTGAAIALAAIFIAVGLQRAVEEGMDQARIPVENFKQVSEIVEGSESEVVFTSGPPPRGLRYYLDLDGRTLVDLPSEELAREFCTEPAAFAYVEQTIDNPPADPACLVQRGGVRIPVISSGRKAEVWLVGPLTVGGGEG